MMHVARFVVFSEAGIWPESACHDCDNPRCWAPHHLYAGDQRTNMQDAVKRGRWRNQYTKADA